MSVACPSTDVDELTICLLTVFEQRGLIFELLEALIKQEIEDTGMCAFPSSSPMLASVANAEIENEAELLRRSCVATKTLSVYAKWKGSSYLRATLQKVLERLMLTSKDLDLELDPARVASTEELQKNALQLRIVAKVFIDDICASSSSMPPAFRKICNIVSPTNSLLGAVIHDSIRFPMRLWPDSQMQNIPRWGLSYFFASSARPL